jgi:hypothetical protein
MTAKANPTKARLLAAGYSSAVAGAAANIKDEYARAAILRVIGDAGIKDGPARAYLIKLIANNLRQGDYPSAPTSLGPGEATVIAQRALELLPRAERWRDQLREGPSDTVATVQP